MANKETNGFEVVFKFPEQEGRRCKADSECSIISFFINYLSSNASEIWEDMNTRSYMVLCHERKYRYAALQNGKQVRLLKWAGIQEVGKIAHRIM